MFESSKRDVKHGSIVALQLTAYFVINFVNMQEYKINCYGELATTMEITL